MGIDPCTHRPMRCEVSSETPVIIATERKLSFYDFTLQKHACAAAIKVSKGLNTKEVIFETPV